ncbi:MAG: M18 family aminopeptidase [Campylobacterota bacterium]|nr:M18 family aminopeptidase [Campylobacterota bacterium]
MQLKQFNTRLLSFLDAAVTPFHATMQIKQILQKEGFSELNERDSWSLEAGVKYFVTRNDSSIIAFTYPHKHEGYLMMGAHTDSPNLKLKPSPIIEKSGLTQFGVEPYGGLLMNPWFDRDLSLAGRVSFSNKEGDICEEYINFKEPIAIIPSLAIHLDKEANKNRTINAQKDIVPVFTCKKDVDLQTLLFSQLQDQSAKRLLSHELSFYDTQKASYVGLEKEFIASARLDNLLSCYVATQVMCSANDNNAYLMVCSDHEEVGSESTSGAAGSFLETILKRISSDFESYSRLISSSSLVSCDNAHAVHPNFSDKHDANHAPKINEGVVVKINANQRYASSSRGVSKFVHAASMLDEPTQEFVTRSDLGCGSTIGPITATRLGIETLDVGLPTFAMHSIRELAGSRDAFSLYKILLRLKN